MKYENILIVIEAEDKKLSKLSIEMLSKGRNLADELDQKLFALIIGNKNENILNDTIMYGADKVINVDNKFLENYTTMAYTKVLNNIIDEFNPLIILIPATENGKDLSGRICARRNIGLVADCVDIVLTDKKDNFKCIRPTFDGSLLSDIRISSYPKIVTVSESNFKASRKDINRQGEIVNFDSEITESDILTEIVGVIRTNKKVSIEDANIIVAGGLGLEQPKNWHLVRELADVLGGAVSGSKPISDQLWIPADAFVGVTGLKVKPKLYIAIGISGSVQHLQGMRESGIIVAINKDPDAPIFKVAHYGIVGDLFEVVPMLIEKLKELKING